MRFLSRDRTPRVDRNASSMGPASIDVCIKNTGSECVCSLPAQRFKEVIRLFVVAAASETSHPRKPKPSPQRFLVLHKISSRAPDDDGRY
jgi:hypothetical protein